MRSAESKTTGKQGESANGVDSGDEASGEDKPGIRC
jgi:hypothetical protein